MTCRWCSHETILTEDASMLSALGAKSQAEMQQAQLQAMYKTAMTPCRKCGAYQAPLSSSLRPDGSGWALWQNPDDSVWLEVLGPVKDGKARTVRWELVTSEARFAWCRDCAKRTDGMPVACGHCGSGGDRIERHSNVSCGWTAALYPAATMGKRDAVGTPWTPPEVTP